MDNTSLFPISPLLNVKFRSKFEESEIISLANMDAGAKKSSKNEFDNAIKGNEEIRNMKYHSMTFEELELSLETNINDSKCKDLSNRMKISYRKRNKP